MMFEFETKVIGLDATVAGEINFDSDDTGAHWTEFEIDNIKINDQVIELDDLTEECLVRISEEAEASCIQEAKDAAEDQGGNDEY